MGADLCCPNCRDNLGKASENPRKAWCGTCGREVRNPSGYREEPAPKELPIGSQTTWTEQATGKTYEVVKRLDDGGIRIKLPDGGLVWVDSNTRKLGWFSASVTSQPVRAAPVMKCAAGSPDYSNLPLPPGWKRKPNGFIYSADDRWEILPPTTWAGGWSIRERWEGDSTYHPMASGMPDLTEALHYANYHSND